MTRWSNVKLFLDNKEPKEDELLLLFRLYDDIKTNFIITSVTSDVVKALKKRLTENYFDLAPLW